ncbi:MAG: hypothetical protein KAJ10_11040 [Thermodesulfovibrionia bacterium]|nr:hypothetical protein [Thermodesulfovibrionia bacterium]
MVITPIEIDGLPETIGMLDTLDAGLRDRAPFHKQAGVIVIAESQENFIQGGNPKWEPLTETTLLLRAKSKKGFRTHKRGPNKSRLTKATFEKSIAGAKVLRDTDILMASIGNASAGGIYEIDRTGITVGTALKKAKYLQEGFETKGFIDGKKVPARPFLVVSIKGKKRILEAAVGFVKLRSKEAQA